MGLKTTEWPEATEAVENDTVLANVGNASRKITLKNILEKILFSSLKTTAKNIIGAINELNTNISKIHFATYTTTAGSGLQNITIPYSRFEGMNTNSIVFCKRRIASPGGLFITSCNPLPDGLGIYLNDKPGANTNLVIDLVYYTP